MSGTFNLPLGYVHPHVVAAVQEQAGRIFHTGASFTRSAGDALAARLLAHAPAGINRAWMRDVTGSTANECAVKLAQKATGRRQVVSFFLSHHGQTMATTAMSGNAFGRAGFPANSTAEALIVPGAYCHRCFYGQSYPDCRTLCATRIEDFLEFASSDSVAAVLVECNQSSLLWSTSHLWNGVSVMDGQSSSSVDSAVRSRRIFNRNSALVLLVGTHFMLNVDSAIVEVALPSIKGNLNFALSDLSWVANSYILAFGGFLLLGGRIGDIFGRRKIFIGGLLLFGAASLAGGLATSPGLLIAARGIQGLAAAIISPTSLSLLMAVFPDRTPEEKIQRNKALGTLGAVAATGGSVGYFLGGILTDTLGWQSTFLINVAAAAAAVVCVPCVLPADRPPATRGKVSLASALTASAGMTLLVYVLVGANEAGWMSARSLGLGGLSVVLLAAFLLVQERSANPLFPLRIFKHRALRGANAVAALINMAIGPVIFFVSLYTQQVLGYSPFSAGLAILPIVLAVTVSSTVAGWLLGQMSQRAVMATGLILFACGLIWMGRISGGAYWTELLGPECLVGLGGGLVFVTFTVSGTSGLDEEESGSASGVLTTSQKVGSAFGLAILTTVATGHTAAAGDTASATSGMALTAGYGAAILVAVIPVAIALVATVIWIPGREGGARPQGPAKASRGGQPSADHDHAGLGVAVAAGRPAEAVNRR